MCNRLSPEKAVIWDIIHSGRIYHDLADRLKASHFTHRPYRRIFRICETLYRSGGTVTPEAFDEVARSMGYRFDLRDRRALDRMLRQPPQARMVANVSRLAQAMIDLQSAGRADLEILAN
ncbi:DnaB-like helicase N-terminal domain-containing protein [Magnetospira sp. QH-2]|uniref:DnaB-like helicase N-terminal domain-containing protein n=1 Tax=Magnetospira sp. (strain QH-2) TaxID=1288970 RepID=UPI0003E80C70|nr:DnaB-like helicase N-terminal domain-containing protein [Magnetospira sp. QH-2]CCQ73156.1 Protein of unknown function [Magnetospira sp. QH-2]